MTWTKLGVEFWDELAHLGLSADAKVTHAEAIAYLYRVESMDLIIPNSAIRRIASTDYVDVVLAELTGHKLWRDLGGKGWKILHHAEVVRGSIIAQRKRREQNRQSQQTFRNRRRGAEVSADISAEVSDLPVSQTDMQLRGEEVPDESDISEDDIQWHLAKQESA
jgi:hypothetical protein